MTVTKELHYQKKVSKPATSKKGIKNENAVFCLHFKIQYIFAYVPDTVSSPEKATYPWKRNGQIRSHNLTAAQLHCIQCLGVNTVKTKSSDP